VGNKSVILINGKRYDAATGQLLDAPGKPNQNNNGPSGMVDGIRRPKPQKTRSVAQHATKKPQKSSTLARKAVKRPEKVSKTSRFQSVIKPTLKPPASRVANAQTTAKSPHVNKFGEITTRSSVKRTKLPLPVINKPKHHDTHQQKKLASSSADKNAKQYKQHNSIVQKALESARSHEEMHHPVKRSRFHRLTKRYGIKPRTAAASTFVLAFVLLGGFYATQYVPNLSMRIASTRAGFSGSMPGYQPSGFSFKGPINYSTGQITISFQSNTDNREFTISQKSSNWNSDALLANYVVAHNKQYQTFLDKGRTLYIFDESNATWVDDGIWYTIEGESQLTTDQLVRIASSL
jgi:hypothetical protein